MIYKIYVIYKIKNEYFGKDGAGSGDEFVGGDHEFVADEKTKIKAHTVAKYYSSLLEYNGEPVWETMVEEFESENRDRTHQWFFKDGKLSFDMGAE